MRRPVLPTGGRLPWLLGLASGVLLAYGFVKENDTQLLIGGLGAAATFVGFILPRLLLRPLETDAEQSEPPADPQ